VTPVNDPMAVFYSSRSQSGWPLSYIPTGYAYFQDLSPWLPTRPSPPPNFFFSRSTNLGRASLRKFAVPFLLSIKFKERKTSRDNTLFLPGLLQGCLRHGDLTPRREEFFAIFITRMFLLLPLFCDREARPSTATRS